MRHKRGVRFKHLLSIGLRLELVIAFVFLTIALACIALIPVERGTLQKIAEKVLALLLSMDIKNIPWAVQTGYSIEKIKINVFLVLRELEK